MYIVNIDLDGNVDISDSFDINLDAPQFSKIGDEYVISIYNLTTIKCFDSFEFNTYGSIKTRYLTNYYRVSRDKVRWTPWLELNEEIANFPLFDHKDTMYLEIKFIRSGTNTTGVIKLLDYKLLGNAMDNSVSGEGVVIVQASSCSDCVSELVIKPPYIYKVFSISDYEIIARGDTGNYSLKYRFSQDNNRTYTQWEPLTKENISTIRINPIRFFQIQYLVEYTGTKFVKIYDLNLIGDFQNVTLDSQKTNVYGTRQDCNSVMASVVGDTATNIANANVSSNFSTSNCNVNNSPLGAADIAKLFQPYQQTQAVNLLNKLSADSNQLFGHQVVYFITDPDKKGIDYTFHEYQLYNYICSDTIKVSVEGNNFPDNQITMNQFDLSLFESFEIHIPKDTFKSVFGPEKRPSKEDFLWFCEVNRMFQVEHAQQFRNFNNSALYYKIMLKKYSHKANVIAGDKSIADKVRELTKNSTIDELFGLDNSLDKKDVANKEQLKPLTQDVLRQVVNVTIVKELIENATTIVSKNHYDLSDVEYQHTAVVYRNFRKYFQVSDNIGFTAWFRINNYTINDSHNFITYYDSNNNGLKINLESDNIIVNLNSDTYRFNIGVSGNADALLEDVWYCYVVNIDQRQRKMNQWIYKRNVDIETDASKLNSTVLDMLYSQQNDMTPVEFELEDTNIEILGSDMRMTNIRLFNEVIPITEHNRLLNQYILGDDSKYLIFADNANNKIYLPNYSFSQINTNIVRGEVGKVNTGFGQSDSQSPPMN